MAPLSIVFGMLLILVGVIGFGVSYKPDEPPPYTAFIPAAFGLVLAILGVLARKDSLRKHAMHAAALVALIGCIGAGVMGVPKFVTMLSGNQVQRPNAVIAQVVMAALCLVFVFLCIKSFFDARRRRASGEQEPV
jgi:amino acid transporter